MVTARYCGFGRQAPMWCLEFPSPSQSPKPVPLANMVAWEGAPVPTAVWKLWALDEYSPHLFLLSVFVHVRPFRGKRRKTKCGWSSGPGLSVCHGVRRHGAGGGSGSVKRSMYSEGLNFLWPNEYLLALLELCSMMWQHILWEIHDSYSLVFKGKAGRVVLTVFISVDWVVQ